jgi:hypothetical protein
MEVYRIKCTTFENLTSWGKSTKDTLIELGFGHQSTPQDKVDGESIF